MSTGLDIKLIERSFYSMKPARRIILLEKLREHNKTTLPILFKHTVLVLESKKGGDSLVADPSFAQFGFSSGIETLEDYLEHKVEMDPFDPFEDQELGQATELQAEFDEFLFSQAVTAITSRTAENVVIDQLDSIKNKKSLFDMDSDEFQRFQDEMVETMYNKELEQRLKIEDAQEWSEESDERSEEPEEKSEEPEEEFEESDEESEESDEDELYEQQLERELDEYAIELLGLIEDCDGVGHQTCSKSLERYLKAADAAKAPYDPASPAYDPAQATWDAADDRN